MRVLLEDKRLLHRRGRTPRGWRFASPKKAKSFPGDRICAWGYTDDALTAKAFDDDGWYHTGDIGVLDEDGDLTITDRKADIIIRGGENISALEVEEAAADHPRRWPKRWW